MQCLLQQLWQLQLHNKANPLSSADYISWAKNERHCIFIYIQVKHVNYFNDQHVINIALSSGYQMQFQIIRVIKTYYWKVSIMKIKETYLLIKGNNQ